MYAESTKGRHLGLRGVIGAADDRARMTHAFAGGRRASSNEGRHGLGCVLGNPASGIGFVASADLADHHDTVGVWILIEHVQQFDEAESTNRIATDADARALAKAKYARLPYGLVGQRATAADDANRLACCSVFPSSMNVAWHDADLASAFEGGVGPIAGGLPSGCDDAGAIRTDEHAVGVRLKPLPNANHVLHRDPFGNAADDTDARIGRLQNGIARKRGGHEDHRRITLGGGDGLRDGIEDG